MGHSPPGGARLDRDPETLRLRAAWLYFCHGRTQAAIATELGISRSTVIRLLEDSRARGEVRFWIENRSAHSVALATALEDRLAVREAIVVPSSVASPDGIAASIGLALGRLMSDAVGDGMTIGVGWGRTLSASLKAFQPPRLKGVRVLSLLGGTVETRAANPTEFGWQLASAMGADCFLFPAPLIVDSSQTRRRLVEACGIGRLFELGAVLDLAIVSVGEVGPDSSSLSRTLIPEVEMAELHAAGAVGDVMCRFIDAEGREIDHPLRERVMALGLDALRGAGRTILASGGAHRAEAIRAAAACLHCDTLVTDEAAAEAILAH